MTNDVARAVQEAKQGHIKFKMDNTSNVHVGLGKVPLSSNIVLYANRIISVLIINFISLLLSPNLQLHLQVSLKEELLRQNVGAFVSALLLAKPAGLKKSK